MIERNAYDVASDLEVDILLSQLPVDLIKENIASQIIDPLQSSVNYLEVLLDKLILSRERYQDDTELLGTINDLQNDLCFYILDKISQKFDAHLWYDDLEQHDLLEMTKALYYQLIIQYRNNIIYYLKNAVISNKSQLGEYVAERDREKESKDVTSIGARKSIKNKVDAAIVANIYNVLEHIINNYSVDTEGMFLSVFNETESYYSSKVRDLAAEQRIGALLASNYLTTVFDNNKSIINDSAHVITQYLLKQ